MYPNYCFRKPPSDFGYDVMYIPKTSYNNSSHPTCRAENHSHLHPLSRHETKMCCKNIIAMKHLRDLKSQSRAPARNVEFRLPNFEQQRFRENAGMEPTKREYHHKQHLLQQQKQMQHQQEQQQVPQASKLPGTVTDPNREIQESCTDFFNLIYENVLEAVHGAIEHMVNKNFEHITSRIDQLAADLSGQEALIKQINTDVMCKLAEQNETGVNQFKFIAQMLIYNQTIFYRALSSKRRPKHHCKEELEQNMDSSSDNAAIHPEDAESQKQSKNPVIQHRLWQQQDPRTFPQLSNCKNCNHNRSDQFADSKPRIMRRTTKGVSTASMPDLHCTSLFPVTRSIDGSSRKCRCDRPTGTSKQDRLDSLRRKLDDVRSHR